MEGTEKIEKTEMEEMQRIKDTEEMEKIVTEEMQVMEEMQEPSQKQYPVHHVPDDAKPVEAALDPVHRLLLAKVVAQVAEVAVQEDLPLSLCLDHHLPLLLLLGSHIVQLLLWADRQEKTQCFLSTHSDSSVMRWRDNATWAAAAVLHRLSNSDFFHDSLTSTLW